MKKINKSALPSLYFAIVFMIIAVIRFNKSNWIDEIFYILAIIGFLIMFRTNKKVK